MNSKYENKKFSIMGDSISTFEGWIPEGFRNHYRLAEVEQNGVPTVDKTWWHRVISHFHGKLLVNNSWSRSCVCETETRSSQSCGCSDYRTSLLSKDGEDPDCIFIYLGSNDRGDGLPLRDGRTGNLSVLENGYALMLDKVKRNYPHAEIWCISPAKADITANPDYIFPQWQDGVELREYSRLISALAKEKGCHFLDLFIGKPISTVDGLHPDAVGMGEIADILISEMEKL